MRICNVVGARPNFMKMAPVVLELRRRGADQFLVHTGQHYDARMSEVFFEELGMPRPDVNLGVGSGSHAEQTAAVLVAFEKVCLERKPDAVMVGGDVNSTLAAALAAAKLNIPVGHVEAGLRSGDRTMPEEINRLATDHVSSWLFASEPGGVANLIREGVDPSWIHHVGNCMVDTLLAHVDRAVAAAPWSRWDYSPGGYALLTLHRPSNVDDPARLGALVEVLNRCAERIPILFAIHPRTQERLRRGARPLSPRLALTEPLPYLTFLGLTARAKLVLTDSGGLQEETTALGVPCLTLRSNTERPSTVEVGTNRLVGDDPAAIEASVEEILTGRWPVGRRPGLWDGRAAVRIVDTLLGVGGAA